MEEALLPAQKSGGRYKCNSSTKEGFVAAGPASPDRARLAAA